MRRKILDNILLLLQITNMLSILGIISILSFYIFYESKDIESFLFTPDKKAEAITKFSWEDYKVFWEGELLEKQETQVKEQPSITRLPFIWVGAMIYSEQQNSLIILSEIKNSRQILLRQGDFIPKTAYKIVSVTKELVKITDGKNIFHLTKPEPGKNLVLEGIEEKEKNKEETQAMPVFSDDKKELRVLSKSILNPYGIKENDKIIGLGNKRIQNLEQFQQEISASGNKPAMIVSVLREGRVITVIVPTSTITSLIKNQN